MKPTKADKAAKPASWANDSDWVEPAVKIPVFFKPFTNAKTVAEFLEKYIEREKVERMAGFAFGLADFGILLPEWAKKASCQFWKNYTGNEPLNPMKSIEDFGVMLKLVESLTQDFSVMPKSLSRWPRLEKLLSVVSKKIATLCMDKLVSRLSDLEKSQYFAGRVRAEKIIERLNNPEYLKMVKRAKVYLAIAVTWKEVEEIKTNAEREEWLRFFLGEMEGEKRNQNLKGVRVSNEIQFSTAPISSREYYDVFQTIGLQGAAPGRPKNPETRADEFAGS